MADRKISDLTEAQSVNPQDLLVVVTGVDVNGATLTTRKFPVSGLLKDIVNIDELVTAGDGISIDATTSSSAANTIELSVTGRALTSHTHTTSDITNFSSAVSGQVQQIIVVQPSDIAVTDGSLTASDLEIALDANSTYLCELGTILTLNEDVDLSGIIAVTGDINDINYATKIYGTWTHLDIDANGHGAVYASNQDVKYYGNIIDTINSSYYDDPFTLVNKFTVTTTNAESDTLTFKFVMDSTDVNTSGVLKQGSWLKAEKVL